MNVEKGQAARQAMRIKFDWFLAGMAAAVALAWIFPEPGARGGALEPELLTKGGVALIFFLHGLGISFAALKRGTLQWPLHLVVQTTTFLFFPLLGLALLALAGSRLSPDLQIGFFYLCALPSTVSSSVALTAVARGNVPASLFNATLSSVIGIALTPLWMGWMMKGGGRPLPLGDVILDLVIWLLLPLLTGQALRPWLGAWAARNKRRINIVDRATILLLVYTSFCDSVKLGVWSEHGVGAVALTLAGSLLIFVVVAASVNVLCRRLGFEVEDRITAIFCGSKKTLASGVPMAQLIFGSHPGLGLILLPIMIYHPLQLVICSAMADRWARRDGKESI